MTKTVDITEFAIRVERLCDFLLAKMEKNGSSDFMTLQNLKDDAADIQTKKTNVVSEAVEGLSEYMKGVNIP